MSFTAFAARGLPEVNAGDDLAALALAGIEAANGPLRSGDIVVFAQKIVSKAEGLAIALGDVTVSDRARQMAADGERDPRLLQIVLDESREVLRNAQGVTISETHHGFVCANAGVDQSNVVGDDVALPLPRDPDAAARSLRAAFGASCDGPLGVVIADSFGRAWREGQCDVAIGCAGVTAVRDQRGQHDRQGRELAATEIAIADEIAAAADLARHKTSGEPVVVLRGLGDLVTVEDGGGAAQMLRERSRDLFR